MLILNLLALCGNLILLFGDLPHVFFLQVLIRLSHLADDLLCGGFDGLHLFKSVLLIDAGEFDGGARGIATLLFGCEALLQGLHLSCQDYGHLCGIVLVFSVGIALLSTTLLLSTHDYNCYSFARIKL